MPDSTSSSRSSSPDFSYIEVIVRKHKELANERVMEVSALPDHLHRIYLLKLGNEQKLVMKGSPSRRTRVLRPEVDGLENEAECLRLLSKTTSTPIPRLLHQQTNGQSSQKFLLMTHLCGVQLSKITNQLSPAERNDIDRTIGQHLQSVSSHTASAFGPISRVQDGRGYKTWGEAFTRMMEIVLRDAECTLINLPYASLRDYVHANRAALDEITEPRLLRMDPWEERDVFVDPETLAVSGLIKWTNVMYGDPFAMEVLARDPSEALLEGFGEMAGTSKNAQTRRHLYAIYHALIAIVSQCFRPRSDAKERDGRRRLTSILIELSTP